MLSRLFSWASQDDTYKVGQVWEYQTRKGEEKSTLTIVAVEKNEKLGTIVNIYVSGLKIKNARADKGFSEEVHHLPFAKAAIDKSVTKLVGIAQTLPDYKEGFDQWKTEFDKGKAGVFTITVKESIDVMEKTVNQ
jgi:hypothetical protein